MYDSDPISFMAEENFEGVEQSTGVAGQDLLEPQWAKVSAVDASYEQKPGKSANIFCRFQLDETYALTPKRRVGVRLFLSEKMQPQIDGWTIALGLGVLGQRFGKGGANDPRPKAADTEALGKALAGAIKGKSMIAAIDVEKSEEFGDKNRFQGWHRVTDENLVAIKEAGFVYRGVVVKERKEANGRKVRFLAVKKQGEKVASASQPAEIE